MRYGMYSSLLVLLLASTTYAQSLPPVSGPTAAPTPAPAANYPLPPAACGCDCQAMCRTSAPSTVYWINADYLLWWVKGMPSPGALVTTGPAVGPPALPGQLGQPGTAVLFGESNVGLNTVSGWRVTTGAWLDPDQLLGVEVRGFLTERKSNNFAASSDATGTPVLAMPVVNTVTGLPERYTIAQPGIRSGSVSIPASSQLWGAEVNGLFALGDSDRLRLHGLVGFRYLDLQERFDVDSLSAALPNGLPTNSVIFQGGVVGAPASVQLSDSFHTRNQFYGGQLGARAEYDFGRWTASLTAKVGLGETHEVLNTAGSTTLIVPGVPNVVATGGRLVGPSNAGHFTRDEFTVVPEIELNIAYKITNRVRAYVGYDFLYWSHVVRPTSQVSTTEDTRQFPTSVIYNPGATATAPGVPFARSNYWAQGIHVGFQFDF